MSLFDRIMQLYPNLTPQDFLTTIRLQNNSDGKGDFIAEWSHPTYTRPTDEELA
jgi:hypothetical protein